jgi:hypothetical protein
MSQFEDPVVWHICLGQQHVHVARRLSLPPGGWRYFFTVTPMPLVGHLAQRMLGLSDREAVAPAR